MRKFTKEHNDINWLFPKTTKYYTSERMFDELETRGEDLLSGCFGDKKTFTRDEMMDAFMKGASEMNRSLGYHLEMEKQIKPLY